MRWFFPRPKVTCSNSWADQYSAENSRIPSPLWYSFLQSLVTWISMVYQLNLLNSVFWVIPRFPLPVLQPGNPLMEVSWVNCRLILFVSHLSEITVLYCLIFSACYSLFFSFFGCFKWEPGSDPVTPSWLEAETCNSYEIVEHISIKVNFFFM